MPSTSAMQASAAAAYESSTEWELSENDSEDSFQSLENEPSAHDNESETEHSQTSNADGADDNLKVAGSVKPLLHNRHSREELNILLNAKALWMGSKGASRKKVFLNILGKMSKLAAVKDLTEAEWGSRQKV